MFWEKNWLCIESQKGIWSEEFFPWQKQNDWERERWKECERVFVCVCLSMNECGSTMRLDRDGEYVICVFERERER